MLCRATHLPFELSQFELDFYRAITPTFGNTRVTIPSPTLSPPERRRQRLAFRNIRSLHRRRSDLSGDSLISMYSPDSPHKVYHTSEWASDAWDPLDYGRPYDFTRPFFEQLHDLFLAVPLPHRFGIGNENSDYINGGSFCRDCYLSFNLFYCDGGIYITDATHCTDCIDCLIVDRCELCYECIGCEECYDLSFSERCRSCSESSFLHQCQRCRNCIGCWNLNGVENYILNEPTSAASVATLRRHLESAAFRSSFTRRVQAARAGAPRRAYFGFHNENSSGDLLHFTRDAQHCFQCRNIEECRHCLGVFASDHCVDLDIYGDHSSWIYNSTATGNNCSNVLFGNSCWAGTHHALYCMFVMGVGHCFGCCGLRNREYCILNRQYSRSEYEELAPRIVQHMQSTGEWGDFFPPWMSPFSYQETFAHELMPLDAATARERVFLWREIESPAHEAPPHLTCDHIDEVPDTVLGTSFACVTCSRPFRIIAPELTFYRRQRIAPPHECPECRHARRRAEVPAYELRPAVCGSCGGSITTSRAAGEESVIYCEECFRREV